MFAISVCLETAGATTAAAGYDEYWRTGYGLVTGQKRV